MNNYLVILAYGLHYQICLCNKSRNSKQLKFYKTFLLSSIDELANELEIYKKEFKIRTNKIVLILKDDRVFKRFKIFKGLTNTEIDSYITNNISDFFPKNLNDYIFDHQIVNKSDNESIVMIAAVSKKIIEDYLYVFNIAKLKCIKVDFYQNTVSKVIGQFYKGSTFVVSKFYDKANIDLLQDGIIINTRNISINSNIKHSIVKEFDFSEAQLYELKNIVFLEDIREVYDLFVRYNLEIITKETLEQTLDIQSDKIPFYGTFLAN